MKKLSLAIAMALISLSASAAGVDVAAVRSYTLRALEKCPDPKLEFNQVQNGGPIGFTMFEAKLESSDKNCAQHKYVLYSPVTQQILICNVFELPAEGGSVEAKVAALASQMLNAQINAKVGGFPLPDGLRSVAMIKQTKFGPFSYHGFVDASGTFLIVGARGNLRDDPGVTLRRSLNAETAGVHRGNAKSKIEIIELSDFECPTCGRAHKKVEPLIEKNLSKINYTRIDLPLFEHHEWAVNAALGAHAVQKIAPAKYWAYVNFVFENQEAIGRADFVTVLKDFCSDHDINWKSVEKLYNSATERQAILEEVSRAFDVGVNSTPTYIVNGQMMGFGPEGEFTIAEIKKAIGVK